MIFKLFSLMEVWFSQRFSQFLCNLFVWFFFLFSLSHWYACVCVCLFSLNLFEMLSFLALVLKSVSVGGGKPVLSVTQLKHMNVLKCIVLESLFTLHCMYIYMLSIYFLFFTPFNFVLPTVLMILISILHVLCIDFIKCMKILVTQLTVFFISVWDMINWIG